MYTIGIDFGTLSGRALLVDVKTGAEVATAVYEYPHGVMSETLTANGQRLPPEWALQDAADYLQVLYETVPAVLQQSGVDPAQVVGIGIDFTSSSPMPTLKDGTPLSFVPEYVNEPHAYVKLWKHHASQPQADRINAVAKERGEYWLARYGGNYSSEWFFSKLLQILDEAPHIYAATEVFIESADWIVWQLTGNLVRSVSTAGYKMLVQDGKYPTPEYFAALHPDFRDVVATKVHGEFVPLSTKAGELQPEIASKLGLPAGIAVASGNIDAHVAAPAVKATRAGSMVMIMGTSTCQILSSPVMDLVEGISGVVDGGVVDGLYGYEAGQPGVGDSFAWFVENAVPQEYYQAAERAGLPIQAYLEQEASKQKVGEHGLLALDWWNGNRSTLGDSELSGLLVGMTLATRAPDIYRALIEATAFGTREIIEAFEKQGVQVTELIAAGGLPDKNAMLRQIYADVTGRPLRLAGSTQTPALGAAIHASVAAGVYADIHEAADALGKLKEEIIQPIPENQAVYQALYEEYQRLYNTFGRGAINVMKRLKQLRNQALGLG